MMAAFLAFVWLMGAVVVVVTTAEDRVGKDARCLRMELRLHCVGYLGLALVWPVLVAIAVAKAAVDTVLPTP